MVVHPSELYKSVLRVHVARHIPPSAKGRPPLLSFDDAYDDILRVLRTGMQWRQLKPKLVSFITVFKTMHRRIAADLFRTAYRSMLRLYARRRRPRHCCILHICQEYLRHRLRRPESDEPWEDGDQSIRTCRRQWRAVLDSLSSCKSIRHALATADSGQHDRRTASAHTVVRGQRLRLCIQPKCFCHQRVS